ATLTVPPVLISSPVSLTALAGSIAGFEVEAGGTSPLSYQWFKNGSALTDDGRISGAATQSLSISNVLGADDGLYTVRITNSVGPVTSAPAGLTVIDPVIVSQPLSRTNH